jgi:hypothetical protein
MTCDGGNPKTRDKEEVREKDEGEGEGGGERGGKRKTMKETESADDGERGKPVLAKGG